MRDGAAMAAEPELDPEPPSLYPLIEVEVPSGVAVAPSERYGGLGLFSTKCWGAGDLIYTASSALVPDQQGEVKNHPPSATERHVR
jgi:hypothetical protein